MMKPQAAALAVLLLSTLASVSPAADRDDAFVGYKELPLSGTCSSLSFDTAAESL
jgi:hypothetical protein